MNTLHMSRDEELPIIRAWYEFTLWMVPKILKFPRNHRFTLGERMEQQIFSILEQLIRARYSRDRSEILNQINTDLEVLRFQIRLAKDLQCLPLKAYGKSAEKLVDIGRQVGGWKKASS